MTGEWMWSFNTLKQWTVIIVNIAIRLVWYLFILQLYVDSSYVSGKRNPTIYFHFHTCCWSSMLKQEAQCIASSFNPFFTVLHHTGIIKLERANLFLFQHPFNMNQDWGVITMRTCIWSGLYLVFSYLMLMTRKFRWGQMRKKSVNGKSE